MATGEMLPKISEEGSMTALKIISPRGKLMEPSPSQRMVIELTEQLKALKVELDSRDNDIAHLRSANISLETEVKSTRSQMTGHSLKLDGFCKELCDRLELTVVEGDLRELVRERVSRLKSDKERLSAQIAAQRKEHESRASDLAAEQVKVSRLNNEVCEAKITTATKDEEINDLKRKISSHVEQEARLGAQITSLRERVLELEALSRETEEMQIRYEISLANAKKDVVSKEETLEGLNSKLKAESDKLSESGSKMSNTLAELKKWQNLYLDLSARMRTCLQMDPTTAGEHDAAINKIVELVHALEASKEKIESLEKSIATHELESKANRETIMRLVAECSKQKEQTDGHNQTVSLLQKERDMTLVTKRELENEITDLNRRLNASSEALQSVRANLKKNEDKMSMLNIALDTQTDATKMSDLRHSQFVETLCSVLGSCGYTVSRNEAEIKEALENFVMALNRTKVENVEKQREIERISTMLSTTQETAEKLRHKAAEAEALVEDKEKQYSGLEGELIAADSVRDALRREKQQLLVYLEELSNILQLDGSILEAGIELRDAISAKCELLVNNEGALVKERTASLYNAQRKVKALKQQLEQKELQMNLQRQKVAALEERITRLNQVEDDRDQGYVKLKKAQRNVEKFSTMCQEKTVEITELKAKLHDKANVEEHLASANNKISEYERQIAKVNKLKEQLRVELDTIQSELRTERSYLKSHKELARDSTTKLKNELTETMRTLEDSRSRERQLLEFRNVLAKVIGLEIEATPVPDYEIISRLEKLVEAHQSHLQASQALEAGLRHMASGFRNSYDETMSVLSPLNKSSAEVSK
ncbi:hypothetical protein ACHWQZ_G000620 [Mnemiopsis leidyi]